MSVFQSQLQNNMVKRMIDDFAIFILSHGRPDKVITYQTLKKLNYTGDIYVVIDNEDSKESEYRHNYGDKVIVFDKPAIAETFDEGDNFGDRRAVIYARNACFNIAKDLGITYFMELDDDYSGFDFRMDEGTEAINPIDIKNIEPVIKAMLDYYKSIPAKSIAMAQAGDFIGGIGNRLDKDINRRRKCMNTFFCSVERPFQFVGRINEDVNTYVWYQSLGNLFFTFPLVSMNQRETQSSTGGMTEMYKESGTYVKSFYTVMFAPSCVEVAMMQSRHPRLHHRIKWDNAVPCIISEEYRKLSG